MTPGVSALLESSSRMPDSYPVLDGEPVAVHSPDSETWQVLGDLYEAFPSGWVLIGGLMVYLLAAEAGQEPTRATADADVLVRAKVLTKGTIRIATWLDQHGLEFEGASAMEVGHRFTRDGVSVDLLVQNHLGERAERRTIGQNVAPRAVGGAGLLASGEVVRARTEGGRVVHVPRPSLEAAIVGKAKAALGLEDADRHVQDVAFLLGLVEYPVDSAEVLSASDRLVVGRAGVLIDKLGFWRFANDDQAARAALRILSTTA